MLPDRLKLVMELLRAVPHDRRTPFQIGLLTELDTLDRSLTVRSKDMPHIGKSHCGNHQWRAQVRRSVQDSGGGSAGPAAYLPLVRTLTTIVTQENRYEWR